MEYAMQAGANTKRHYGETEELLGRYAWYVKNTNEMLQPLGRKKPNALGLFDTHGNCYVWCQEAFQAYPNGVVEDREGPLTIDSTVSRVLRGGAFGGLPSSLRSAYRLNYVPTLRSVTSGLRPARTLLP